jgi:VIT1/CCC1 family predicted Fe2+/Mn2+ transporter
MKSENWKAPLSAILIFAAFLLVVYFVFLPDLARMRTGALVAAAISAVIGLGLFGFQRWRK